MDAKLAELRQHAADIVASAGVQSREVLEEYKLRMTTDMRTSKPSRPPLVQTIPINADDRGILTPRDVTEDDVLRWAEEVG